MYKHSKETRLLISLNNANKLSKEEINKRTIDFIFSSKKRGYISKLAEKWNISHTSAKRFLNGFCKNVYDFGEYYELNKVYGLKDEQIKILEDNLAYTQFILMSLKESLEVK